MNPFIKLEASPFYIVDRTQDWAPLRDGLGNALPRRAGVSSFGFGGANAHVLLEEFEAPQPDQTPDAGVWRLATLSARSESALRAKIRDLTLWLEAEGSSFRWDDIVATLNEGRPEFEWRLAAVAHSASELREVLQAQLEVGSSKQAVHGRKASAGAEPALVELLKHVQERLGSPDLPADDRREKLLALGDLFVKGYSVDWETIPKPLDWRRVSLPVYPFERRRFWVPPGTGASPMPGTPGTLETKPAEPILFVPRWKLVPAPGPATTDAARDSGAVWIVHSADSLDTARRLAETARPRETILLDISDRDGIETFLRDHARPRPSRVCFLSRHPSAEDLQGWFWLLQALSGCEFAARPLEFCLVTLSGGAADAGLTPTAAALHALARTAASENPGWRVDLFDLDSEASLDGIEAFGPMSGRSVLVRFGRFLLQELVPVAESVGLAEPFKKRGTYFIAGGAGGVGFHVSLYLAERYQANLVWTGRRPHDAAIQEKIERIEKAGGRVVYFQADITNAVALAAAAGQARDRFGAINGVIHSAIRLHDGLIGRITGEDFAAGLGTHLQGSGSLAAVFAGDALDFLVFFSTSAVFAAREGIAAYVSGSAYKDAMAAALSEQRTYPVRVVNWGYWGQLGLGAIDGLREEFERLGIRPLTIEEAMRAVSLAIRSTTPQLVCARAGEAVLNRMGATLGQRARLSETGDARSAKLLQAVEAEPPPVLDVAGVERFVAAFGRLDRFARRLLVDALRRMGVRWRDGASFEPESLGRSLGVTADYSRLFGSLLRLLRDHGYVAGDERGLTVTELGDAEGTHLEDAAIEKEAQGILRESPDITPYLALIRACVTAYPEVLTGRRHHMEVMFPNGSSRLVQGIYSENPLINFHHRRIAAAMRSVLSRAMDGNDARNFRVIEAGAGTGGLTRVILAAVGDLRARFEYVFTDVSKGFVDQAKTEFGSADAAVDFRLLDLEREPEEQGFELQAADAVVCSNVLHAVRHVGVALRHLKQLLRPGGLILIHEAMARQDFSTLTFGLTTGWWRFEDESLRIPASPLLAASTWLAQCLATGFRGARVLGLPGEQDTACAEGVLIAESDGVIVSAEGASSAATVVAASAVDSPGARAGTPAGTQGGEMTAQRAREYVRRVLATVLKLPKDSIEDEVTFDVYGVDSLIIMELRGQFEKDLGQVPTSLLFSKFTVAKLADHFLAHYRERLPGLKGVATAPVSTGASGQRTERAVTVPADRPATVGDGGVRREDIAVVGLSGSYPGALDLTEFWRNLEAGKSSVSEIPPSRWDWRAYFHPDPDEAANGRCYCKWGGFVADHDKFDPLFFGISPREAEVTDPQERLFLQTAWAAIEDAGYTPRGLRESAAEARGSVGVFVGVTKNSYQLNGPDEWVKGNPVVANSLPWSIANRVSYQFDFQGPSMPVDTACSSSLTAFHAACESIRGGDCAVAVVGGVNLYLHPSTFVA
ncbi:MAG: SDR family NAD(P)-dependent oxidoreductase, partial [Verrucomicrobia bacterium]|nr:SDR family NAD(P)-dependent oxidoreductase [Verrucomicrobiota bacterium]